MDKEYLHTRSLLRIVQYAHSHYKFREDQIRYDDCEDYLLVGFDAWRGDHAFETGQGASRAPSVAKTLIADIERKAR